MNKFLLIALVACSLGFQLQYVVSEKAVMEPVANDAISETVNDFEVRKDTLAGDLEDEEGNTEDDVDEEQTTEDEGEEESEMDDEDEKFEDDDDDYRDEDEDEDEDLKNRYLDISPNKAIKMNAVSVNEDPFSLHYMK